jgi:uncharacterized protein
MIQFLSHPWPWYVSGPLLGMIVPLLFFLSNKEFALSGNLRHLCAMVFGRSGAPLDYDWKKSGGWSLIVFLGIALGGFVANVAMHVIGPVHISPHTTADLAQLGIEHGSGLLPASLFSWRALATVPGFAVIVIGGFLVGFGSRWAGGCTSGHGVSGLANFELPSLIAIAGFFIGGITATFFVLPLVMRF